MSALKIRPSMFQPDESFLSSHRPKGSNFYPPFSSEVEMYRSSSVSNRFQDVETTIRGLTQDLCMAFNTGNYDQMAALFAPDGVLMAPNRPMAEGGKAIERVSRGLGEAGFEDLRFETVRVTHSGDLAVEIGRYSLIRRQDNGTVVTDRGKYVQTWRRLGAWLLTAQCWNSDLAAGRPAQNH